MNMSDYFIVGLNPKAQTLSQSENCVYVCRSKP